MAHLVVMCLLELGADVASVTVRRARRAVRGGAYATRAAWMELALGLGLELGFGFGLGLGSRARARVRARARARVRVRVKPGRYRQATG